MKNMGMQLDGLQQYIRYALSQLPPQNGTADFEKISFYFARYRIHRNILPATGPVQAGGDQGRDFETFHTYLRNSSIANSAFLSDFSDKPVAFACSLEKNPTKKNGKIFSDVKTITASGVSVGRIYFFSGHDIPVAARHKTQADIKRLFNVELEIIDAQALSQHLSDADLFWVATQFLKVPSEFYPERKEDNWYSKLLKEYKESSGEINSYQEFEEVKSAIRFIYKNEELKSDLIFWLPKLDGLITHHKMPNQLIRKAIYERFVASLVGLDFVEGQEQNIKQYFEHFEDFLSTSDLEDAQHLLSFCMTSHLVGRHKIPKTFLDDIGNRMDKLLSELIQNAPTADNRCGLLDLQSNFYFHDFRNDHNFVKNFGKYLEGLNKLLKELPKSNYFPVDRLSDRLNSILKILINSPVNLNELEKIANQVDELLSKRAGVYIAGQKLRDRAMIYLESGDNTKAIEIFHDVKVRWYNQDTVKGTILTCLLLAKTYQKQELFIASKYYGLVAAYLAYKTKDTSLSDKILQGIANAADCDYVTGSWLSYMRLMSMLLGSHSMITKDFDVFDNKDSIRLLYYPSVILEAARRFIPEAVPVLEEVISDCGNLKELFVDVQDKLKEELDSQEFLKKIESEIKGAPFNDLAPDRIIVFNACGCDWHFSFKNNYETSAICEEFISIFQIFLQDISNEDLHLRPGRARIHIVIDNSKKNGIKEILIEDRSAMLVTLSRFSGTTPSQRAKHTFERLAFAQGLTYHQSMLPYKDYDLIVANRLKNESVVSKITFGQAYEVLFKEFNDGKYFNIGHLAGVWNIFDVSDKSMAENAALPWKSGLSPRYNSKETNEAIDNRIRNLKAPLSVSLPLLIKAEWFQTLLTELKVDGWLDWQILHALAHLVVNYKAQFKKAPSSENEAKKMFFDFFEKDEAEWYVPLDASIINKKRMRQELEMMLPVVLLRSFNLENRSQQPDVKGILKMLIERFRFFEDGKEINLFQDTEKG
ncbi:hypothetical protein ACFGVS_00565 [Mucilaginibacter sp. AW1-7]|uniref:hypothetical protein n=1 Tax=Mucilaginibacter sp. AW1-7 TaxID=3349874 RepID=UPI003F734DB4